MPPAQPSRRLSSRQWIGIAIGVLVIAAVIYFYRSIDLRAWREAATRWNPVVVIAALMILPLLFFPVSVLQVMVGVRFGSAVGMALVFVSIVFHLLVSYGLVKRFRPYFERWTQKLRKRIPKGAHGPVTLFTLLLPGAPYAAQNYALPVAGVPFGVFLRYALPLHTARSVVAVFFGDHSDRMTPGRIAALVAYAVVLLAVCAWTYRRLRSQLNGAPAEPKSPQLVKS